MSLWKCVLISVEARTLPENGLTKELINYSESLKANVSEHNPKLLGSKPIQSKLMSWVVNLTIC
ncbi:MAG: hypothetical protein RMX96_14955 [Nostoc sp. ChiSLP02]|nr:hypothetical protein [Nostoc sp. DedSLP05]MDZ8101918.1 hypothetical protein [Nostoc sp. DedSLP01]MDZ8186139.1 hypothetical protein [Nostoc sp. ChiSLP02]